VGVNCYVTMICTVDRLITCEDNLCAFSTQSKYAEKTSYCFANLPMMLLMTVEDMPGAGIYG
jgi:hypothetical protein